MPKKKLGPVCKYKVVIDGLLVDCGEPAIYRHHSDLGTPLCKLHGDFVIANGFKVLEIREKAGAKK